MLTGSWVSESNQSNGLPANGPLPTEYTGLYTEGGDGTILGSTELDFTQIEALFIRHFLRERFGYGQSADPGKYTRVLNLTLVQNQVFGVFLLDSFTPPGLANEFFEFPAYTQAACQGSPMVGTTPLYGACQHGPGTTTFEDPQSPLEPWQVFNEAVDLTAEDGTILMSEDGYDLTTEGVEVESDSLLVEYADA